MSTQYLERIVNHPVNALYAAFTDFPSYSRIFRMIRTAKELRREPGADGGERVYFEVTSGYGPLAVTFQGRAELDKDRRRARLFQESGPFETLEAAIELTEIHGVRTLIAMEATWSFAKGGLAAMLNKMLESRSETVLRKAVAAFVKDLERK
jgi:ribosome-associated toxin RatA of RatAB toxin-antitoxin module